MKIVTLIDRPIRISAPAWKRVFTMVASGLDAASLAGLAGALPAQAVTWNLSATAVAPAEGSKTVPSVAVPADKIEVSTGKFLSAGEKFTLAATGYAVYGYDNIHGLSGLMGTTPDGNIGNELVYGQKFDEFAKLPSAPVGSLIGRVGSSAWFAIGELVLAVNDVDGLRGDNSGGHTVYSGNAFARATIQAHQDSPALLPRMR